MSNDEIELLKLAAKAVRADLHFATGGGFPPSPWIRESKRDFYWNPLTDDGDALRLAAKLELAVMHRVVGGRRVEVLAAGGPLVKHECAGDVAAAMRRAIVLTAADIGRKA